MVSLNRHLPRPASFLLALTLALTFFPPGCGSDGDRAVVDFDKTLPVARPKDQASRNPPLRVAVAAMVSPRETFDLYRQLLSYLSRRAGKDVEFVQRKTYVEIDELLKKGEIDLAFICSGPYVADRNKFGFAALAVPEIHGSHFYRSYLIVNKESPIHHLEELKGHTFAFTDPDSNTGRLVPTYWLAELHERPETFFTHIVYTYSHDNSIMAVARNLVDGATVDGLIWEFYQQKDPTFTSKTRIIKKSEPFGVPPLVAAKSLSVQSKERIQHILFSMHQDPEGKKILAELMIDRFIAPQEEWYDNLRQIYRQVAGEQPQSHAP